MRWMQASPNLRVLTSEMDNNDRKLEPSASNNIRGIYLNIFKSPNVNSSVRSF